MNHRQASASANRPISSRPMSGVKPAGAAGPVPGTASRLINTAMQRPASKAGAGQGVGLNTQIKIADRPISQQGLATGIKTASKLANRQIQDKSYYMGLLRTKMTQMANEISKLNKETTAMKEEHSSFTSHEKRAEELATELKKLTGEMADYNLLVDKLNTDTDKDEVQMECQDLQMQNEQEAKKIDDLFVERQQKEGQISQLEKEIEQELHMADNLVEAMNPELRLKYSTLKNANKALLTDMENMQQQIDSLQSSKVQMEDEMSMSHMKQEALSLHHKLRELEEKREELLAEEQEKGTPAQERERLLKQVKEDNQEMSTIDKQTTEIEERINKMRDEINNIEQDLDGHQGERNQKYLELKKKEESMDAFLGSFGNVYEEEKQRIGSKQTNIVGMMERISRNLLQFDNIPANLDLDSIKNDLAFKQTEMEKSKSTVSLLQLELQKLSLDLQKIEELESKIGTETEMTTNKIAAMQNNITKYSDLDSLKQESEDKKQVLLGEREKLLEDKGSLKDALDELEDKYNKLQNEVEENEMFKQIVNLQKKLQHHEQNNFVIKEAIANKMAESDYKRFSKSILDQVQNYNRVIKDSLSKPNYA